MNARVLTSFNPVLNLSQVPSDISAGEHNPARKFPSLLHVENRALSQRNHCMKLAAIDESSIRRYGHDLVSLSICKHVLEDAQHCRLHRPNNWLFWLT